LALLAWARAAIAAAASIARAVGRWVFIFLEAWLLEEVELWFGELDGDERAASFV
jgi:hypothetical protein